MIEIRNQPAPLPGAMANDSNEPNEPAAHEVAAAHPDAGAVAGTDPLARFGATHGFHPDVALYTRQAGNAQQATKAAPPTPPQVYDISKLKPDEVEAMKNSADPATRKLGITIANAQASYGDFTKSGATILVMTSHGNGGEPVMVVTGPKFNPAEKARVITFYHGDNATVADPVGSKAGLNTRIRDAVTKQPQTVFVLPEAVRLDGKPWKDGVDSPEAHDHNDYEASWKKVNSQAETTDEALKARGIAKDKVGTEIVAVHSRGGSVIARLMDKDAKGQLLRANRLELYDSLYGSQSAAAAWGKTKNGKAVGSVIYYHGTNDAGAENVIARTFRDKFVKIDMGEKLIGVPDNKIYKDADGNKIPRNYEWKDKDGHRHVREDFVRDFHESAHYKTTGIFLGRDPGLNAI
jgi:hypothetical protein